jgi:hypothetical protein
MAFCLSLILGARKLAQTVVLCMVWHGVEMHDGG